jgi:Flp pilus assembly protein TadG
MRSQGLKHQAGQILILAGLGLVMLVGFGGLAIDSGRSYGVKAKLNAAVDAAAIAAGRALAVGADDAARSAAAITAATNYYNANFPTNYLGATRGNPTVTATHDNTGKWTVNVAGSANMPVAFMGVLGLGNVPVLASGQAIRRDLDIVLVMDLSGSIKDDNGPGGSFTGSDFDKLRNAARDNLVKKMIPTTDRVGLVYFSSGGVNSVAINTSARGFDQTNMVAKLNALTHNERYTGSAEGMRLALNQLNSVTVANRSSLRMIVFFSDGAPNMVPAVFCNGTVANTGNPTGTCPGGKSVTGDLFSETNGDDVTKANTLYSNNLLNSEVSGSPFNSIATLPKFGLSMTKSDGSALPIPLASQLGSRTMVNASAPITTNFPYKNTLCNVNRAARNMLENVAYEARSQGIKIYSIGLGGNLTSNETSGCGYTNIEYGSTLMKRVANTSGTPVTAASPNNPGSDTFQPLPQPTGLYVYAAVAADLASAFSTIVSEILRLTQ